MSKKLFASLALTLATALSTTAAFADQRHDQAPVMVADHRGNDAGVLDSQRATGRFGSLTLSAPRGSRDAALAIVSSDPRLDLGRIVVTYAGGKSTMVRSNGNGAIELPAGGRIASVRVSYVNRGGRGAIVKLVARDDGRGNDRGDRGNDRADRGGDNGPGNGRTGHR